MKTLCLSPLELFMIIGFASLVGNFLAEQLKAWWKQTPGSDIRIVLIFGLALPLAFVGAVFIGNWLGWHLAAFAHFQMYGY